MLRKKVNLVSKYAVSEQEVSKHVDSMHEFESANSQKTQSKSNIHLLDIGSGTGYFLNAAKEKGYTVTGIEKDNNAREQAITNFGLDIKDEQSLWSIENESIDVTTLWHVLEHMENLNEVVAKINSILKPNGVVIIALPNHNSHDAKKYKGYWAAYDVPRHLWHFTPDTVEKLLGKHHFNIITQKTMPLDAFYISMLSEKYKGSGSLMQYIKGFTVGAVGYMSSLSDINNSSSVIYIAKKESK
jgi:SAM-dependent methyltransferase